MKKILIIAVLFCYQSICLAQDGSRWQLSAGAQIALPIFNMEVNSIGTGLDMKLARKLTNKWDLTGDAGFNIFFAKKEFVPTGLIPLKLGAAYWLKHNVFVFGKTGLGIYMLYAPGETITKNFWGIELGPGFKLSDKWDLSFSYNGYQNSDGSFGFISTRVGYFLKK